jgi:hypothetical protein
MALTFSVVDTWDDGKRIHVSGTVAATGNYPPARTPSTFRRCRLLRQPSHRFGELLGWMVSPDTTMFSIPVRQ